MCQKRRDQPEQLHALFASIISDMFYLENPLLLINKQEFEY
jgi:hypothetical protein